MSFTLDAAGEINRALEYDAMATILDVQVAFNGSMICKLVNEFIKVFGDREKL